MPSSMIRFPASLYSATRHSVTQTRNSARGKGLSVVYVLEHFEGFQFLDGRGEELDAFVCDFIVVNPVQNKREQH